MASISITQESEDCLHISCFPSQKSWAIFAGILICGLGIGHLTSECCFSKLVYFVIAGGVAVWYLGDWQNCILNKANGTASFKTHNIFQRICSFSCDPQCAPTETVPLDDILIVRMEATNNAANYGVVVKLTSGATYSIAKDVPADQAIDCQRLASRVHRFLQLDLKYAQIGTPCVDTKVFNHVAGGDIGDDEISASRATDATSHDVVTGDIISGLVNGDDSSSGASDESFERIDTADLLLGDDVGVTQSDVCGDVAGDAGGVTSQSTTGCDVEPKSC